MDLIKPKTKEYVPLGEEAAMVLVRFKGGYTEKVYLQGKLVSYNTITNYAHDEIVTMFRHVLI